MAAMVVACAGAWAWGQIRVGQPYGQQVNTQVTTRANTQLYGGGAGPGGSVRYSGQRHTSNPLPSEWRHAYWKSGATPSDVRMGYAALGPMAPTGPMAYIPPKPTYLQKPNPAPTPPPMRPSTYSTGSVRYAAPSPNAVRATSAARPLPSAQVSSALMPSAAIGGQQLNTGSVRYTR